MKRLCKALGGLLAVVALALPTQAATTTLADLLRPGGSIIAGDKLFDNWSLNLYETSVVGRSLNAANISVTSLDDGDDDPGPGLKFDVLNGELSITGDDLFAFIDLSFGFRASVLPGAGKLIKDNTLKLTSALKTIAGDNGSFIKETIGTAAGLADVGDKDVEFSYGVDPLTGAIIDTEKLSDSAAFAPQNEVWVTKNIFVWATGLNENAALFGFEQRFSQTNVPEPGSLALVALALAGLGFARRQRS